MAVVSAIARVHGEEPTDQLWVLSDDINPDALDSLFQGRPNITVRFRADHASVTVEADDTGETTIYAETLDSA